MRKIFLVFVLSLIVQIIPSFALVTNIDKTEYMLGEDIIIDGVVDTSTNHTLVVAKFYNSSGTLIANHSAMSIGGSNNIFAMVIHTTDPAYINLTIPGDYVVNVSAGNEAIPLGFKMVSDKLYFKAHLAGMLDVKFVNTNNIINISNTTTKDGHNFSELKGLSLSGILHYGTYFNLTEDGMNFTFVLVDNRFPGIYDSVYIDKSANFSRIWKSRKIGEKIDETVDYVIAEVEFATGNKIILAPPINDSMYSGGEEVYFVGFVENSTNHLKGNQTVNITLVDSEGNVINSTEVNTTEEGCLNASFKAPNGTGNYFIEINGTPAEVFSVENFKLYGEITNLAGTPTYLFTPNPKLKIVARLKTLDGQLIDGASVSANISYPDGTTTSVPLTGGNGTYESELNLEGKPEGKYKVDIIASYSNKKQEFLTAFEIRSVSLQIMAINTQFLDSAGGPEAMVDSFAPNSKVSIAIMLINSSKGLMEGPPEEVGVIDIEDYKGDGVNCSDRITVLSVSDENGEELNKSSLNLMIVNMSVVPTLLNVSDEGPPEIMHKQCMVIFDAPQREGFYKVKISVDHPLGKKESTSRFSIQKLYARANPVDFRGDDFWFYAPNETIKIKLKITDLLTRRELDASKITDAKIIEMYKVWPSYKDVFTDAYRAIANETLINGTIRFVTPDDEGFFMFKFKFKANLSGTVEEGTGTGYFMLKKYMIWGEPMCQMQPCIFGSGENISIRVNVVDINKASLFDIRDIGKTQLTCTDCDGLEVDVNELWNDQLMKKMEKGADYKVIEGFVYNSSATLTINPVDLPSGWYHIDLKLTDLSTNDTYFGWAGFEIRNFWIDARQIDVVEGNLTASFGMGGAYGVNSNVLFGVVAYDPQSKMNGTPQPLIITNASLENINLFREGPPIVLKNGTDYNYKISKENVTVDYGGFQQEEEMWIINITGINKTGNLMANVKVKTNKGTDIGTYWFRVSPFLAKLDYMGKDQWPVIFAPDDIVVINVSAYTFNGSPVILNETKTGVRAIENKKIGEHIKPPANSTTVTCTANNCTITVNLSKIISSKGRYNLELTIVDIKGNKDMENIEFETRSVSVFPPTITEVQIEQQTDTPKRELRLENREDSCLNNNYLSGVCSFNQSTNITNCTSDMNGQHNINTSSIHNATMAGAYCISGESGEWHWGYCSQGETGTDISVAVNGTHFAYNLNCSNNCIVFGNYTIGQTFEAGNITWKILNITPYSFKIKNAKGICGKKFEDYGASLLVITPPNNSKNFSNFYFGYIANLIKNLQGNNDWFTHHFPKFNSSRPVYVYHNTTHLWMSDTPNFSSIQGIPLNGIINDSYGGKWKVLKLDSNSVVLYGQNVLAQTGAFVNTSLSKSGVFKLGAVNEEWLGYFDPNEQKQKGIDLNGDGKENSTVYFMISDSQKEGLYDTLFYSNTSNFSIPISVNSDVTQRTFGEGSKLVLLSIAPNAKKIKVYTVKPGDWSDLGQIKLGDLVRVPVMIQEPSVGPGVANVTITHIRLENSNGMFEFMGSDINFTPVGINASGELIVNLSQILNKSMETGRYTFGLAAITKDGKEIMEERRWPFVEVKAFLADSCVGEGGYINNFKKLNLQRYREDTYGMLLDLMGNISEWGKTYDGVFANPASNGSGSCPNFAIPSDANNTSENWTLSMDFNYWVYLNAGNNSKVWIKQGDCNFSNVQAKNEGDQITILDYNNHSYMFYILAVNNSNTSHGVVIGLKNFNSSKVKPLRHDWNHPKWRMMALNLSGVYYNIVLANSTLNYPMCSVLGIDECAKVAWFDTDGDFSNAINVSIGENFTSNLYLASIGPGPWEGITIGNLSGKVRPGIGVWIAKDTNTTYFAAVNETEINLDLDRDGARNKTYYIFALDDFTNNNAKLTQNIVDDDPYITEDWWGVNLSAETPSYYDFYGEEIGIVEMRSSLPTAIWNGNLRFGKENKNMSWKEKPNWDIVVYNNTSMLIRKNRDMNEGFNISDNVTFILKAYNFDHTPIINASISVEKIMKFTHTGGCFLEEGEDYTTVTSNKTDNYGYALVTIAPNGTWSEGDYMVKIRIDSTGATEVKKEWFKVVGGGK